MNALLVGGDNNQLAIILFDYD